MSHFLSFLMDGVSDAEALAAILDTEAPADDCSLANLIDTVAPAGSPERLQLIADVMSAPLDWRYCDLG